MREAVVQIEEGGIELVDIATISAALGLVGTGIKTIDSAKGLQERLLGRTADGDTEELKLLLTEVIDELLKSKMAQLEAQNKLWEILREAERGDEFAQKFKLYKVSNLPDGGQIFSLREADATGHMFHRVCPNCLLEHQRFMPLQGGPKDIYLHCNACEANYQNQSSWNETPSWDRSMWADI
ncbi:hypothetical protein [Chachezhania antarctica]|uniref:hypothetical protein n=1 Tax=Chachezhania antarctica TaxID=2340860 RepID=UPI0013CF2059|nr:hypothetical protein [Chachezhania antarctica]